MRPHSAKEKGKKKVSVNSVNEGRALGGKEKEACRAPAGEKKGGKHVSSKKRTTGVVAKREDAVLGPGE